MTKKQQKSAAWSSDFQNQDAAKNTITSRELLQLSGLYLSVYCYEQARGTITTKRNVYELLAFYADWRHDGLISTETVSRFLFHVRHGHEEPDGRWGGTRGHGARWPCAGGHSTADCFR